jgi:hypothetical protein
MNLKVEFLESQKPIINNRKSTSVDKPLYWRDNKGKNYYDFLLYLFNNSAKHGSIIKSKCKYIFGGGFKYNPYINGKEKLNDLVKDVVLQYELFNSFYIEVIRNKKGNISEIKSIPSRNIVKNIDSTKFWYVTNPDTMQTGSSDLIPMALFGMAKKGERELFYYNESSASNSLYPEPQYTQAINYISADVEVSKHTYTNSMQGFKPTKHITLVNGEPSEDIKKGIKRKFANTYSGESGESIILDFVSDINRKTIIEDLGSSDLAKEDYSRVDELIRTNIFTAHEITSPSLFGISVPGSIGDKNNLEQSFEIFNNVYASNRRVTIQEELKKIFAEFETQINLDEFYLTPVKPIGLMPKEHDISNALDRNEMRKLLGYEAKEGSESLNQSEVITALNTLSPLIGTKVLESMTPNEVRALAKLPPREGGNEIGDKPPLPTTHNESLTDDAIIEMFASAGVGKESLDNYITNVSHAISKGDINDILGYISDDATATIADIADALDLLESDVKKALSNLENASKIKVGKGGIEVIEKPTGIQYRIMFSYEWKNEIPSSQRDTPEHPSRDFCKKLIALNRYYSRKDIETISNRLGYSVFDRAGGWWNSPSGTSASCRHEWQSNLVKKTIK